MEWGMIITGFYLMGMVAMALSALNSDLAPQVRQVTSTEDQESLKEAA